MRTTTLQFLERQCKRIVSGGRAGALAALGLFALSQSSLYAQATVATIGGGSARPPYAGYLSGNTLTTAMLDDPCGLSIDSSGSFLYVADYTNNAIRLI